MSYTAHTSTPACDFWKSVLACLTCSIICCSLGWSQTPIREVSGIGAQASAHGVDASGVLMDVQVIFNATAQITENSTCPLIAVFLTETYPGFEKKTFASLSSNDFKYWYSADGALHLTAALTLVGNGSNDTSSSREAVLALNWGTKTGVETVSTHDSYTQSGRSITRDLSGTVQRTTVSGAVNIDSFSVPLESNAASYWGTTNNKQVDQNYDSSTASSDTATISSDATCSGFWGGYWTWVPTPPPGQWVWTWVWYSTCGVAS